MSSNKWASRESAKKKKNFLFVLLKNPNDFHGSNLQIERKYLPFASKLSSSWKLLVNAKAYIEWQQHEWMRVWVHIELKERVREGKDR